MHINIKTPIFFHAIMMMMEEEEVEFSEDHIDAMKETTNQIIGAISTKMKSAEENAPSPGVMNAQEVTLSAEMFEQPDLITAKFSLKIADSDPTTIVSVFTASSVESLMKGEAATEAAEGEAPTEAAEGEEGAEAEEGGMGDLDISGMLDEVEGDDEEIKAPEPESSAAEAQKPASEIETKFDFLMDLTFPVSIELGRTKMLIKDILELGHGSVIEFEKLAGEPVDLLVDDKKIAEGEVVVVDEHFGIRVTSLIRTSEILKELGSKS
ncbi:flagellar motor switch protein FliN [candidate division KSB1 bacterium]|nr:flagellar motor switch protein FliN [candidate division KSB1 bacterium]